MRNLIFTITALIAVSCSNTNEEVNHSTIAEIFSANSKFKVRGYVAEQPDGFENYDSDIIIEERDNVPRLVIYGKVVDWREADKITKDYINRYRGNLFASDKIHDCSALMLDKYLLNEAEEGNQQLTESIAYYTDILIEYKTYESKILAESLRKLKGYWPQDKLKSSVEFGLDQVARFESTELNYDFLDEETKVEIKDIGKSGLQSLN